MIKVLSTLYVLLSIVIVDKAAAGCVSASTVRVDCGVPNQFATDLRVENNCKCSGDVTITLDGGGIAVIQNVPTSASKQTRIGACSPNEATWKSVELTCTKDTPIPPGHSAAPTPSPAPQPADRTQTPWGPMTVEQGNRFKACTGDCAPRSNAMLDACQDLRNKHRDNEAAACGGRVVDFLQSCARDCANSVLH